MAFIEKLNEDVTFLLNSISRIEIEKCKKVQNKIVSIGIIFNKIDLLTKKCDAILNLSVVEMNSTFRKKENEINVELQKMIAHKTEAKVKIRNKFVEENLPENKSLMGYFEVIPTVSKFFTLKHDYVYEHGICTAYSIDFYVILFL